MTKTVVQLPLPLQALRSQLRTLLRGQPPTPHVVRGQLLRGTGTGGAAAAATAAAVHRLEDAHRLRDHRTRVADVGGHDDRVALLGDAAEGRHVLLGHAQPHRRLPALAHDGRRQHPDGRGVGRRLGLDRRRLAQPDVGVLLHRRLRGEHRRHLPAARQVDLRLLLALRVEHERALPSLRLRLELHGGAHGLGRRDVADLVAHARDAPLERRRVDRLDDVHVERLSLLEGVVERDLTNLGAHRRLRELRDGKVRVLHAVGGLVRVHHLDVQHAVDGEGHVVAGDGGLRRHKGAAAAYES
eukprot:scaffold6110_cov70-Phaeocystis_antarctica.AAC.3